MVAAAISGERSPQSHPYTSCPSSDEDRDAPALFTLHPEGPAVKGVLCQHGGMPRSTKATQTQDLCPVTRRLPVPHYTLSRQDSAFIAARSNHLVPEELAGHHVLSRTSDRARSPCGTPPPRRCGPCAQS
eukprot:2196264-Prymnesium_polylepis.1